MHGVYGSGMEIRHLRHFVAVVDAGNLSKAAERAFISQPALTRSIRNLEDIVGAPLLERRPRGVVPTPAGDTLYAHARLVLNECARAKAEVKAVQGGARGQISIGIAAMFAEHVVDDAIVRLCRAQAPVSIQVTQGFFEEMLTALQAGVLDAVFCNLPSLTLPDDVTVEPLLDIPASIWAGTGTTLPSRGITREDLARQPWAVVDQTHMELFMERFFGDAGLPAPRPLLRTNSIGLIRKLIYRDAFLTLLPDHLMAAQEEEGFARRILVEGVPIVRRAGLIRRATMPNRPALEAFCEELRAACGRSGMHAVHG